MSVLAIKSDPFQQSTCLQLPVARRGAGGRGEALRFAAPPQGEPGVFELFFKSEESKSLRGPAPAAGPSQKHAKNQSKSDPEKRAQKSPKSAPKGSPNAPQWEPKSATFCKKCLLKRIHTKMCQSHANEAPQDFLQPQKLCSRLHGSIVFTFPLVRQKWSKMAPTGTLLEPFGFPNGPKVSRRTLQKNNKKSMRFVMPPGLQNDTEITSKWSEFF